MQQALRNPTDRLLNWLARELVPLGVQASHLLDPEAPVSSDPWFVPSLASCAADEDGWTARQIAFGADVGAMDPQAVRMLRGAYISAMASKTPLRTAMACVSSQLRDWPAVRAYLVPYKSELEAHLVALQLALAIRDHSGAETCIAGNNYVIRTTSEVFGVLDGRPLGRKLKGDYLLTTDLQSLLLQARAIPAEDIRRPILALREASLTVLDRASNPTLVRDAISALGLITAYDWTYDGSIRSQDRAAQQEVRLDQMIDNLWVPKRQWARSNKPRRTIPKEERRARWEQSIRTLDEASAHLNDPALSEFARLRLIYDTLVPDVWGMSTFARKITPRDLMSVRLDTPMYDRITEALQSARLVLQTRLNKSLSNA